MEKNRYVITLFITDEFRKEIKLYCVKNGVNINEFVELSIKRYLESGIVLEKN